MMGYKGVFAYSADGINWTAGSFGSDSWIDIAYGAGKFVAVGSTGVGAYSTDGINWTTTTLPSGNWYGIAYGAGKFVAVGFTGVGAYSTDGINWTTTTALPSSAGYWESVVYGNGRFVAVDNASATTTNVAAYLDFFTVKLVFNADGSVGWVKA
jgi:hypothetical protein